MSYSGIAAIVDDYAMRQRLTAAAAEENKPAPYPDWVAGRIWDLAATPGWSSAWDSAVAAGITQPGSRDDVITDAMILAAVQPMP